MRTAHACHKHTDGFAVALSKRLFRITLANIVSLKSIKNTFQSLCPSTLRRPICLRICIIVPWYLHHIVHLCTGEGKSPFFVLLRDQCSSLAYRGGCPTTVRSVKREVQLPQRGCARESCAMLRVIEYNSLSLKDTQDHSQWHHSIDRMHARIITMAVRDKARYWSN